MSTRKRLFGQVLFSLVALALACSGDSNPSDSNGNGNGTVLTWQQTYGGAEGDRAGAVAQAPDGGFVVAGGYMQLSAGSPSLFRTDLGGFGNTHVSWLFKVNNAGNLEWQEFYSDVSAEFRSLLLTEEGGMFLIVPVN